MLFLGRVKESFDFFWGVHSGSRADSEMENPPNLSMVSTPK